MPPLPLHADTFVDDDGTVIEIPPFRRFESQIVLRQIAYYLCGDIVEPLAYAELLNTLRTASENDIVFLHLNTAGGNLDSGLQIINNMRASKAHVITVLEARAYSMGALIFLAGDELVVHDNCQLMLHNYSGSLIGKGNEQHAQVVAIGKWFEKIMSRVCYPFLSHEEISKILRGEDIWMDSDEIRRRLQRAQQPSATTRLSRARNKNTTTVETPAPSHGEETS